MPVWQFNETLHAAVADLGPYISAEWPPVVPDAAATHAGLGELDYWVFDPTGVDILTMDFDPGVPYSLSWKGPAGGGSYYDGGFSDDYAGGELSAAPSGAHLIVGWFGTAYPTDPGPPEDPPAYEASSDYVAVGLLGSTPPTYPPVYLFHSDDNSSPHIFERRPTAGVPPLTLPGADASSAYDEITQTYRCRFDSTRKLLIGADSDTGSLRVIDPASLTLIDEYPIGNTTAGLARHCAYDPIGDRYYLAQNDGATSTGESVTIYHCAPDGTDVQSFPLVSDMSWAQADICTRNDGLAGIQVVCPNDPLGTDPHTCAVHRFDPDGTRVATIALPATGTAGISLACVGWGADTIGNRMATLAYDSRPQSTSGALPLIIGVVLEDDTWVETWYVDDFAGNLLHANSTTSFGVTTWTAIMSSVLTADPVEPNVWWAGDQINRITVNPTPPPPFINHYHAYKIVEGDSIRVGEYQGDMSLVAGLIATVNGWQVGSAAW